MIFPSDAKLVPVGSGNEIIPSPAFMAPPSSPNITVPVPSISKLANLAGPPIPPTALFGEESAGIFIVPSWSKRAPDCNDCILSIALLPVVLLFPYRFFHLYKF